MNRPRYQYLGAEGVAIVRVRREESVVKERYRIVQWGTGRVGTPALAHLLDNPVFEVVGVLVFDSAKVGKDAGELAERDVIGVAATDDADTILALDADCVFYTPARPDLDVICRLLRSGKNVVTTSSFFYPTDAFRGQIDQIEGACREGDASFHGSGIHPGYAGDLLPLTLTRIMSRVEHIQVYEVVNFADNPSKYVELMGFGSDPGAFLAGPNLLGDSVPLFEQAMTVVADGLGASIDEVTTGLQIGVATADIAHPSGLISTGTLARQHHTWTARSSGRAIVVYHAIYTVGDDDIDPPEECGPTRYRVVAEGEPTTEIVLAGVHGPGGDFHHPGYVWTAMAGVNAIPDVCDAAAGFVTHFDLGLVRPRGLWRV
jgi:hypothetical protein